jgi:hypothetical protein
MSSITAMSLMCVVETGLWAALCLLFRRKKLHLRFSAMSAYLLLRVVTGPILILIFYSSMHHWFHKSYNLYFFTYWPVYIANAILLYFVCFQVFCTALSPFTGLVRLGRLAFRWAALVSVVVSFFSVSFPHLGWKYLPSFAYGLMRSISIIELCLLAFLTLSMNALRISVRDRAFGIALGFGVLAATDLIQSAFSIIHTSMTSTTAFVGEAVLLVELSLWIASFALPEPERKPMMLPVNSTILRWNEIASALGHTGTQVAVQPAGGFFLTDVEKAVETALARNVESKK